ncbi:hypothetical protein XI92_29420 [Bacillus thuringiensis]|nr:hypothetical protein XI92_29420 [Bacillus thuringiensis]
MYIILFQNENNRISGRGAKPHLLKFHFIFFKKPFGLNDMKNLCLDSSILENKPNNSCGK